MKSISVQDFLTLPDWKKVKLKKNDHRYLQYPVMTDEEEQNRKEKIYRIASHYSQIPFDILTDHPDYTLDTTWPSILERFMTPKLLEYASLEFWCQFGFCYFCAHWKGDKRTPSRLILKRKSKKVFPLSGNCRMRRTIADKRRNFIAKYDNCCNQWLPDRLYQSIYSVNIERGLRNNLDYSLKNYKADLSGINIWDYFFDKYGYLDNYEEVY